MPFKQQLSHTFQRCQSHSFTVMISLLISRTLNSHFCHLTRFPSTVKLGPCLFNAGSGERGRKCERGQEGQEVSDGDWPYAFTLPFPTFGPSLSDFSRLSNTISHC